MPATFDDVIAQVNGLTDVDTGLSAVIDTDVALLTDLKTRLDAALAAGTLDPAKVQAVSDALGSHINNLAGNKQRLIDAVTANTPA